jgi:cobalamin biosynthesis protein CobD/CbiB
MRKRSKKEMINKSKKTDMNDFEQSIVLSVTCIPMTQVFMLLAGSMPTGLALFLLWCPVIWQISAVFFAIRFFKNNPRKKMKAWSGLILSVVFLIFVGFFALAITGLAKRFG